MIRSPRSTRRCLVQQVDEALSLSAAEDVGLQQALVALRAGHGRTLQQVRETIDAILHR